MLAAANDSHTEQARPIRMSPTMMKRLARIFVLSCLATGAAAEDAAPVAGYRRYVTGDPSDVVRPTSGLLVPQGGGDDVDANYARMGKLAGGGDFVVLRASGDDDYNEYIYGLCGCDSVETIVFSSRDAAYDPTVIETIRNAEAIFIAGGDQSNYVRFWKGTPVEDAINFVAARPAPIGGTSAGMAIMGEFSYSAMSAESLTTDGGSCEPVRRRRHARARFPRSCRACRGCSPTSTCGSAIGSDERSR